MLFRSAKGRVILPISLKNQLLPVLKDGFVIKRSVFQKCLELYPKDEFDQLMQKVMKKSKINRKYDAFVRNFVAGMKEVSIDGDSGRLQIPKNLVDFAGIGKEVVLNAVFDKIEIWDKVKYEKVLDEGEKDYADLAEEIFADDD